MPKWYPWFARVVFLIFCVMIGWASYIYLIKRQIGLSILGGQDILAIIGLSFGIYSTTQIILRYIAIPAPRITLENRQPTRLGPEEALPVPNNATEIVKQEIEQINWKRQFAIHKVQVWNHDVHWLIRPLMQRVTVEGCIIRFRYALLRNGQEEPVLNGEWLHGRWDDNMEPVSQTGFDLRIATVNRRLAKLFPTEKIGNLDAYPFKVAFSMKREGEENLVV